MPTLQTPSITAAYLPVLNDNQKFKLCDTNNVQPGAGGENVSWDFSNLIIEPFEYTDEYIEPSTSTLSWHFPLSNLARKNIDISGDLYEFLRLEPNPGTFQFYGYADSNINGLVIKKYIPYINSYKNGPITYNYMNIDSGLTYSSEPGFTANGKFMDTVRADGWGSIRLPGGVTYNNVLRVITSIAGMDTVNGSMIVYSNNRFYSWYTIGYKFPVLRIQVFLQYSQSQGSGFKEVQLTTQNVPINKK